MARPLKKKIVEMNNGVLLTSLPTELPKGRHWMATHDNKVVGEFKTWQASYYTRPEVTVYGRGGGQYSTAMVRQSWLAPPMAEGEDKDNLNTERQFNEWKKTLVVLRHPKIRKVVAVA